MNARNYSAFEWIDGVLSRHVLVAFDQIDRYQRYGHCTPDDVIEAMREYGWGENVIDAWVEYRYEEAPEWTI